MMERVWWSCWKLRVPPYRRALLLLLLLMTLPSCCIHTLTLRWELRPRNESIDSVSDRTLCRVSTENTSHLQMLAWIGTRWDRACCWCRAIIIYLSFRTISACCLLDHERVAQVLLRFARLFAIGINPCIRWWHDHHRWRRHVILMISCPLLLHIFALF